MSWTSRTLVRSPDMARLAAELGGDATLTPAGDGDFYIAGVSAAQIGDAAQRAGLALHQLASQRPDLEAAYLELTAGKAGIR
jgi:ABC-2 type transport system ATP-binding protein